MSLKVGELWYELGIDARPLERGMDRAVQGGTKKLDTLVDTAKQVGRDMGRELERQAPAVGKAGDKLADAAGEGLGSLKDAARDAAREAVDQIDAAAPRAKQKGQRIGKEAGEGVKAGLSDGVSGAERKVETELDGIDGTGAGRRAGEDAGSSLSAGFGSSLDDLGGAVEVGLGSLSELAGIAGAGVAVANAFMQGFNDSLHFESVEHELGASLGGSTAQGEKYGRVVRAVYSNNFGDSIDQVQEAVGIVVRNMDGMRTASEATLSDVTSRALTVASAFDQDLGMTINAVSNLLRNGLAPDVKTAFDIITRGLQGPANKGDDLLETFNEYSVMFKSLGLTGEQALGLLQQGVQGGARDADIAADALKEFSIRAKDGSDSTAEAFAALGLDTKRMAADVASGGPQASQALDLVLDAIRGIEDPVKRNQVAVSLFGTQVEDMQDAFLKFDLDRATSNVESQIGKIQGASDESMDRLSGSTEAKVAQAKRDVGGMFTGFWDDAWSALAGDWETGFTGALKDMNGGLGRVAETAAQMIVRNFDLSGIVPGVENAWTAAVSIAGLKAEDLVSAARLAVVGIVEWFASLPTQLAIAATNAYTSAVSIGGSIVDGIGAGISGAVSWLSNVGKSLANAAISVINVMIERLNAALQFEVPLPFGKSITVDPPDIPQIAKFATGGTVPGTGNHDTVPAMLTPGEYVVRKTAAQRLGRHVLERLNTGQFSASPLIQQFAHSSLRVAGSGDSAPTMPTVGQLVLRKNAVSQVGEQALAGLNAGQFGIGDMLASAGARAVGDLNTAVTGDGRRPGGLVAASAAGSLMSTEAMERELVGLRADVRTLAAMADRGDTFHIATPQPDVEMSKIVRRRRADRWLTTGQA